MALAAGDSDCTVGLSARIYDYWIGDARSGFVSPLTDGAADVIRALCYATARAVVDEIVANAAVSVEVRNGGLQKTPNPNNADTATAAPDAPVTLTGTVA